MTRPFEEASVLVRTTEACALLACSTCTLNKLIESGELTPVRFPGSPVRRFRRDEVEALGKTASAA